MQTGGQTLFGICASASSRLIVQLSFRLLRDGFNGLIAFSHSGVSE
jgi:hypothetical protein